MTQKPLQLTKEQIGKIVAMRNRGESLKAIAKKCRFSASSARNYVQELTEQGLITYKDKPFDWTKPKIKKLKWLFCEGHTYKSIAGVVGCSEAVAIKAVQKYVKDWQQIRDLRGKNSVSSSSAKDAKLIVHKVPDIGIPPRSLPLHELTNKCCHYPVNTPDEGDDYVFCGNPAGDKSRYCKPHYDLCITRVLKKIV